jgi:phosphoglucosamine mutase
LGKLFGTDGIRGEANRYPMDPFIAFSVGQAITHLFKQKDRRNRIIIGKDTRISGDMLESSLIAGITSMGGEPFLVGVLPTSGVAMMTKRMQADAGVMISASHNPYQDNGLKIFSTDGSKLPETQEERIEELIFSAKLSDMTPSAKEIGRSHIIGDSQIQYTTFLKNCFPNDLSLKGLKIVTDTANGATYKVAPKVFAELGAEIHVIHDKPNGLNINENCGSQFIKGLQNRVLETQANIGLAFDGDGDRMIAVDENGKKITGDQILIICAKSLKDQGMLKNNLLVGTVMSNLGLRIACKKNGIRYHAANVGDRNVLMDMQRLGSIIGGEDSGHIIFLYLHTSGDGIISALQLMAVMIGENKRLSELAGLMDIFPQRLINVEVKSKPEISTLQEVVDRIRYVEAKLGDHGRVLVRYSGTQNMCRVMVEGPTDEITHKYCQKIADAVKRAIG